MRGKRYPFGLVIGIVIPATLGLAPSFVTSASAGFDPGIGNVPLGTQSDQAYGDSFAANSVANVFVTSQQVSCYRPEVPFSVNNGPNDGYTGELRCPGATTHEDTGGARPYPPQGGGQPPHPPAEPEPGTGHPPTGIPGGSPHHNHPHRPSPKVFGPPGAP